MKKIIIDNNVLRYMAADSGVEKELRKFCSAIYLSVIVLEEIIARIDEKNFNQYKNLLQTAKYFGPILPEPSLYCAVQWGTEPGLEILSGIKNNLENLETILLAKNFKEISEFVNSVKLLCRAKRSNHNKAFSQVAKGALKRWEDENRNLKDRLAFIKDSYNELIQEKNQSLFLKRIRETAFSVGMNLSSQVELDEKGLGELIQKEKSIILPEMTTKEYEAQRRFFEGYIKIYASYVARRTLKSSETSHVNDFHDLALSRYLSFEYSIVTSDKIWSEICSDAGFSTGFLFRTPVAGIPLYFIKNLEIPIS